MGLEVARTVALTCLFITDHQTEIGVALAAE
jgi:hypothetical protein